jgi:hypothetical protein
MMTAKPSDEISFRFAGTDKAVIDWGDGSAIDIVMLTNDPSIAYSHKYSDTIAYVITLTGDFTGLRCSNNQLTSLDVSKNTVLTELDCNNNQLTNLDVSGCTVLQYFYCQNNQLTALNLSHNEDLFDLDCSNNSLTSLDVGVSTRFLDCSNNRLSATALNAIMTSLLDCSEPEMCGWGALSLNVENNPGTDECDKSIAGEKGWYVE